MTVIFWIVVALVSIWNLIQVLELIKMRQQLKRADLEYLYRHDKGWREAKRK